MRIFYDWEFYEDGQRIYPISVGMVAEDGRELYVVNADMPAPLIADHPWLMENVVPHLPTRADYVADRYMGISLDFRHPDVRPLDLVREMVLQFVRETPSPELWAWYGAYDHVCLAQLFGPMVTMPREIPWFTNDIRTLALLAGPEAQLKEPGQVGRVHHALDDAKHDAQLFDHYMRHLVIERASRAGW